MRDTSKEVHTAVGGSLPLAFLREKKKGCGRTSAKGVAPVSDVSALRASSTWWLGVLGHTVFWAKNTALAQVHRPLGLRHRTSLTESAHRFVSDDGWGLRRSRRKP